MGNLRDEGQARLLTLGEHDFRSPTSSLREAEEKLHDLEILINEVEEAKFKSRVGYHAAYDYVMNRRLHPEKFDERQSQSSYSGKNDFEDDDDVWDAEAPTEAEMFDTFLEFIAGDPVLRKFMGDAERLREMFEDHSARFDEQIGHGAIFLDTAETEPDGSWERLKSMYRSLVRKLHPDYRQNANPRLDELWHKVQAAYSEQDVEAMEMLVALCGISMDNSFASSSVSQIMAIIEDHREQARMFERNIRTAKKDPAWNFDHDPTIAAVLEPQIAGDLSSELAIIQENVSQRKPCCLDGLCRLPGKNPRLNRRRNRWSCFNALTISDGE